MKSYVMGVIGALTAVAAAMGIAWAADIFKIEKGGVAYLNLTDAGNMSLSGYIRAANLIAVPQAQWPDFDAGSPYLLKNALWVGWDDTLKVWKYTRQTDNTRGLTDPGNPNTWTVDGTAIGYFDGNMDLLPSGTHINNRYDPRMMAARCNQDDIQVKIGATWVDKYTCRIVDVTSNYAGTTWKDDAADMQVSAQATSPYWMAFSQKGRASTGMTWFVAQQAAINAGKRMCTNGEWQAAASGTARGSGNGVVGGSDWSTVADQDVSRYGVVGMAGNVWEWVDTWGQYGPDNGAANGVYSATAWGANYGDDGTWNIAGAAYTNDGARGWVVNHPAALLRGGILGLRHGSRSLRPEWEQCSVVLDHEHWVPRRALAVSLELLIT